VPYYDVNLLSHCTAKTICTILSFAVIRDGLVTSKLHSNPLRIPGVDQKYLSDNRKTDSTSLFYIAFSASIESMTLAKTPPRDSDGFLFVITEYKGGHQHLVLPIFSPFSPHDPDTLASFPCILKNRMAIAYSTLSSKISSNIH
jgi:hypothetical protein